MFIEKRIVLNKNIYFIRVSQEYKKNEKGDCFLAIKGWKNDYFDGGDFSTLIEKIEKAYTDEKSKEYSNIGYIGDILYIYDRVPFLCGIKDVYMNNDNIIFAEGYISKEEIEKIILNTNVTMNKNENFKLWDEKTWFI